MNKKKFIYIAVAVIFILLITVSAMKKIISPAGNNGRSGAVSSQEKKQINGWIKDNDLNDYGDPRDTLYSGGTPLFDEYTGTPIDRYQYLQDKFPQKPWQTK